LEYGICVSGGAGSSAIALILHVVQNIIVAVIVLVGRAMGLRDVVLPVVMVRLLS
jgi:hypothetical protein